MDSALRRIKAAIMIILMATIINFAISFPSVHATTASGGLARIAVSPPDVRANVNGLFPINITISNVVGMAGYEFRFNWNTSILTSTQWNYTSKTWIQNPSTPTPYANFTIALNNITVMSNGLSRFWLVVYSLPQHQLSLPPGISGAFTVAKLQFKMIATGQSLLDLSNTVLSDPSGNAIGHSNSDGMVTTAFPAAISIESNGSVNGTTAITGSGNTFTFTSNIVVNSLKDGIIVKKDNIVINGAGHTLQGSGTGIAITLEGRTNVTIKNLKITTFTFGVKIDNSLKNTLTANNITSNTFWGIKLSHSSNNTLTQNSVSSNRHGIYVWNSSNYNTVNSNTAKSNMEYGIIMDYASNRNNLSGNTLTGNSYGGIAVYSSYKNTLTTNSANQNNYLGIVLGNSANCTIATNNATSNGQQGIALAFSSNTTITSNKVSSQLGAGIIVSSYSANNNVTGNTATSNAHGIQISIAGNNKFCRNIITGSGTGLTIENSMSNKIVGNNVTNSQITVSLNNATNNKLYYNNFIITSGIQVSSSSSLNTWDNGYPSGGNYWSDYKGIDVNKDGIGDTPYVIDSQNQDRFPLMTAVMPHNIAVIGSSKTIVGQGFTDNINATIVDRGLYTETISSITFSLNTTTLATYTNVNVQSANSTIKVYTWNTTSYAKAHYLVKVVATPVPSETFTTDNTYSVTVQVTKKGDINGDNAVNVLDLIIVSAALGSGPSQPNWNPNADLNNDNQVNVLDLILLAAYLGT